MTLKQPLSRLLSLLLLTASMLSALPALAVDFTIGSLSYNSYDDSTVSVSNCDENATGELIIPESVEYDGRTYSVTSIGNFAFDGCWDMTSVTIPNSVTSIGDGAFSGCSSLTVIQVESGNPYYCSLDEVLFTSDKSRLIAFPAGKSGEYQIPNSVTSIGSYAFYGCISLASVTIPNSVTSIGNSAFSWCSGLTSVTIPNTVTSIGAWAFSGCGGLTSVTIPNSVTSIGESAFCNCISLTSVTIPNTVTSIGAEAFYWCSGLTSVTIPNTVTSIGAWAFSWCSGLTSVTIPNSVTSIGDGAFSGCDGLTSVSIPNSVTSIGHQAFRSCSSLTEIQVASGNPNYCSLDGVLFNSNKSELVAFPGGRTGEYQIPNSVTSIGWGAFEGCSGLTSVTIPNSVTSISDRAFYNCSSLTSVTIPSSVTNIGYGAFYACISLTSVTIPSSVTSIGKDAFGDDNLMSIYLFGKSEDRLKAESVYTFFNNEYSYDNAVYLVGEISTTQTTAEFDVQIVGEVESFDFEYLDANDAVAKATANQSGRISLGNLNPGSTTGLIITVHMANGEAYDYTSEITTKRDGESSAIEEVKTVEDADGFDVYTLSGVCVRRNAADLNGLRPGVYIANGRKYIVR